MKNKPEKADELLYKLEYLLKRQNDFSREINHLRDEINSLKSAPLERTVESVSDHDLKDLKQEAGSVSPSRQAQITNKPIQEKLPWVPKTPKSKSNIEKFIGENLINKIGIVITIIGVSIGTKYSIEHNLISPLTRIILGYLFGLGLLGFSMKLKVKYENFSAVLLSGAMAIMYFITYSAYGIYDLLPQTLAFSLMVVFTGFTVLAALKYDRQVIAHIGLVGAYAVPFLLSDGSGKVVILFTYMAIINAGILVLSFKKHWKPLYYSAFALTWLIYFSWYGSKYQLNEHFSLALIFLSIFFVIFYVTFLAYKVQRKEIFKIDDIVLLLSNSFIFYGIGYAVLNEHVSGKHLLGLFTLCHAIVHFIVSTIIFKQKLADKNLLYVIIGLVLIFITIAIPVQLDGNWVTLLWVGEAALLFWIGRTKNVPVYEMLSYPLMLLASISIAQDWVAFYGSYIPESPETRITPLLNINFLSSLLFIGAFGYINVLHRKKTRSETGMVSKNLSEIMSYLIPAILCIVIYFTFRIELLTYWKQLYADSALTIATDGFDNHYWNYDLKSFKSIWVINYSLLFVAVLSFINFKWIKSETFDFINFVLSVCAILVFLTQGLYEMSELRESYLQRTLSEYYQTGINNIIIRYVSLGFLILSLLACYTFICRIFKRWNFKIAFDFLLHITVLWVSSSELIHLMDMAQSTQSYKLGLSILWGVYSLLLIILGMWKKKRYLRIGAMSIFGVILLKLFLYDISHLNTISKFIVLVSLGILLLIISFLYNKYKHLISDEGEN